MEPEKSARTHVSVRILEAVSQATTISHHQIFVTGDTLHAAPKPVIPAQDEVW